MCIRDSILLATKHQDRYDGLKKIMATIDPYICIIFANKRTEVSKITRQLREDGYKVGEIHGDLEPRERKKMMRQINNNEYQYIVATDIAARGIDIDGVSHVINMQFPTEPDFYIHRSGCLLYTSSHNHFLQRNQQHDEHRYQKLFYDKAFHHRLSQIHHQHQ